MGRAEAIYGDLIRLASHAPSSAFDRHLAAAIIALAAAEAEAEGTSLADATGLDDAALAELAGLCFPGAGFPPAGDPMLAPEELALNDILWMNASRASAFERILARLVARRSRRPNHLWQDLGLSDRSELSMLMEIHFPGLARRNVVDMKWKKFFYRMMCGSDGFRMCAAPVCSECDDFDQCFGAEDGEALLARMANGRAIPPSPPIGARA